MPVNPTVVNTYSMNVRRANTSYSGILAHLRSRVCLDVLAHRAGDESNDRAKDQDEETVRSVKQVEHLGNGHVERGAHDARDDADDSDERVRLEVGNDVGRQIASDGPVERSDKVDEPHADLRQHRSAFSLCQLQPAEQVK